MYGVSKTRPTHVRIFWFSKPTMVSKFLFEYPHPGNFNCALESYGEQQKL